ncbi:MAG: outer membrane protein assembly factor BamA [Treponema sp.]|jgi:outer membrane protein insertion porin family|nr:outer membrane protein assembly factor BamA [Treponema sp.]
MRLKVFAFLFFAAAVCLFSQEASRDVSQEEWYQGKPIKDIVFSGLKNVKLSEIEALINPYKGRIFDDAVFYEIQGKLYALEYFERIDTSTLRADTLGSEVVIRFTVIERPVIGRINFVGNSGLRRNELLDVISIKVSDVVNQIRIRADTEAIKNKYLEKGYPNVTVQTSETQGSEDATVTLVFYITEGEKISIKKIEFQGNSKYSDNTLKGQLSLKAKSLLGDGAFQEAKLLADREAIAKYYHDRGYIDAEVKDVTRTLDSDDKGTNMILTFLIEEGIVFTFGGVAFEGNKIFSSEQLGKLVLSKVGDTVNEFRLEADLQRVSDLYYENGYIFNSIIRIPEKNYQTGVLSYTITIVERGRAHIENIVIRGNNKTKTDVIRREIPLEPGDVFSRTKVMDAMRNLYNLQFFSMVMPETPEGSAESLMDLIFTVEEQPTTDLQFGLTFSGNVETFPVSGLLKWNDRNVAGTGNQLGAELNSSVIDTFSFSINYLHRWLFGLPFSGGVDFSVNYAKRSAEMNNEGRLFNGDEPYAYPDGFYSYEEYAAHSKLPPRDYLMDFGQWYLSLGFSTGYRWSTVLGNLGVNGGIRFGLIMNTYDADLYRPFDPKIRERNNEWTPKNSFWFLLSLDQRDIFYDPSSGYYLSQRMGFYGLFNDEVEHYNRSDTKAEYFLTLFNIPVSETWSFKSVLALHSGLSLIYKQPGRDTDSLTPSIEEVNQLAVDGMFVGRGWSGEYRNKGLLLWENWVELRFPLVRGMLAFDLFFDAAGVERERGYYFGDNGEGPNFTIENMRFSYGGGLRLTIPQFPFRFSFAKRFRVSDGEFTWEPGAIGGDPKNPAMGVDFVISFVLSY